MTGAGSLLAWSERDGFVTHRVPVAAQHGAAWIGSDQLGLDSLRRDPFWGPVTKVMLLLADIFKILVVFYSIPSG